MRTGVAQLSFMGMAIANMTPDNVGTWLLHCHVSFHNAAGMAVRYRVDP
jgi:FtsP/CotA-like multicopper oxidase with cupredoxin domain